MPPSFCLVSLLLLKVAHRNMLASLVVEFFCNNTHPPINNKSNSRLFDRIKIKIYNFAVADAGEVWSPADAPESTTSYSTTRLEMYLQMKYRRHQNLANYGR